MNVPVAMTAVPIYRKPRSKSMGASKVRVLISATKPRSARSGSSASKESTSADHNSWEQTVFFRESPTHRRQATMSHESSRSPAKDRQASSKSDETPSSQGLSGPVDLPNHRREQLIYVKNPAPTTPNSISRKPYPASGMQFHSLRENSVPSEISPGVYELEGSTPTSSRASSRALAEASSLAVPENPPPYQSPSTRTSNSSITARSPPQWSDSSPAFAQGRFSTEGGVDAAAAAAPPSHVPVPVARSPASARGATTAVQQRRSFTAQRQTSLLLPSYSPPRSDIPPVPEVPPLRDGIPITPLRDGVPTTPTRTPSTPRRRRLPKMAPANTSNYASASNATALNPAATYQHIQDMAAKRISTLDYLRKTHEGRVYWFNTLLFSQPDILRLPSFQPPRLARRASNLLLLGLSIPQTLDANSHSALDYVRALNALLAEFETYQSIHPPEGGTNSLSSGSFGRSKLPKMFSRGHSTSKTRRASTATDIGLPLPPGFDSVVDTSADSTNSGSGTLGSTNPSASASSATLAGGAGSGTTSGPTSSSGPTHTTSLPAPDATTLLPGEEYSYLLTPSLPFEPDFFEVFATLSEVLIDVYMRLSQLVSSPEKVALQPGLAEAFAKADSRIRKVLVLGIVKEFEEATRQGSKLELGGVGRVALGGLT